MLGCCFYMYTVGMSIRPIERVKFDGDGGDELGDDCLLLFK